VTGDSGQKPKTVTITRIAGYGVPKYTPSCNGPPFERLDPVISHFAALEKAASCFCQYPLKARFFQWLGPYTSQRDSELRGAAIK
jgi:hypothetical protein